MDLCNTRQSGELHEEFRESLSLGHSQLVVGSLSILFLKGVDKIIIQVLYHFIHSKVSFLRNTVSGPSGGKHSISCSIRAGSVEDVSHSLIFSDEIVRAELVINSSNPCSVGGSINSIVKFLRVRNSGGSSVRCRG